MQVKQRDARGLIGLGLRGVLMGAADAVPGVSGGTIAFMTGIYEELIYSLKQCGPEALKILITDGLAAAWKHINGLFLLCVFGGVIISLVTLSHAVTFLLESAPVLLWSFFFGLIIAAVWSVIRHIPNWTIAPIASFLCGSAIAFYVTVITPTHIEASSLTVFLSGMVAICAMILPGISGSFILLLLGMYAPMLNAIKSFEVGVLALFASGCVVGLLSFSRVLNWMFEKHKVMTLALLGGFMLGSLNKIWPWKIPLETIIDRHGNTVPLIESNVLPATFETVTGQPAQMWFSLSLMILGVLMVIALEKIGNKTGQ